MSDVIKMKTNNKCWDKINIQILHVARVVIFLYYALNHSIHELNLNLYKKLHLNLPSKTLCIHEDESPVKFLYLIFTLLFNPKINEFVIPYFP